MQKLYLLFLYFTTIVCGLIGKNTHDYNDYLNYYGKDYNSTPKYWNHYYSFNENLDKINKHNKLNLTWEMGVNKLTDISASDFKNIYLKAKYPKNMIFEGDNRLPIRFDKNTSIPFAVDWRSEGLVTNVKDQGECGSCWAFSAIGSLEGAHAKKTGNLTALSEQNLVDCAQNYDCHGCEGGWMSSGLEYILYNNGVDTEAEYPYSAADQKCQYVKNHTGATVNRVVNITKGNTEHLLYSIALFGPVSVAIDAEFDFQNYKSGIYTSTECGTKYLNHGVLVVGYGVTSSGNKYYIIKNSWGTSWGMDGYAYWNRDVPNMCGIAEAATFPLV